MILVFWLRYGCQYGLKVRSICSYSGSNTAHVARRKHRYHVKMGFRPHTKYWQFKLKLMKSFCQNLDSIWQKAIWRRPCSFHLAIFTEFLYLAYLIQCSVFLGHPVVSANYVTSSANNNNKTCISEGVSCTPCAPLFRISTVSSFIKIEKPVSNLAYYRTNQLNVHFLDFQYTFELFI